MISSSAGIVLILRVVLARSGRGCDHGLLSMAQQRLGIRSCEAQGARHAIAPWRSAPEVFTHRLENGMPRRTERTPGEQPGGQEIRHTVEHAHHEISFEQLGDGEDRPSWRLSGRYSAVARGDQDSHRAEQAHAGPAIVQTCNRDQQGTVWTEQSRISTTDQRF